MQKVWADGGKILGASLTTFAALHLFNLPKIAPWVATLVFGLTTWLTAAAHSKGPTDARNDS